MKYLAIMNLEGTANNAFKKYEFKAEASTTNAAINKARKQATNEDLNAMNSRGNIEIYKQKDFDKKYLNTISAWN